MGASSRAFLFQWPARLRGPVLRDALGIGALKILAMPITLVLSIILARSLGPESYGIYAFVLSILGLVTLILSGGLAQLLTREVAVALQQGEPCVIKGITRASTIWVLLASGVVLAGGSLYLSLNGSIGSDSLSRVLVTGFLALPILCLSPIWSGTLRGYGFGAKSQLPNLLLMPLVQLALVLVLHSLEAMNARTAMAAYLLANLVVTWVGLSFMRSARTTELILAKPVYQIKIWAQSSFIFTNIVFVTFLNTQVGVLLLGFLSTPTAVGSYQIAERGAQFVGLTSSIIELVLAPHVAKNHKARQKNELQKLYTQSRRYGVGVATVIALPLFFMGAPIVNFLFGEDYVEHTVSPLAILSLALLLRACLGPCSTFLTMTGNERSTLFAQGIALFIAILLNLILSPSMGSTGAAWAAAAGTLVWSSLMAWQVKRKLDINLMEL